MGGEPVSRGLGSVSLKLRAIFAARPADMLSTSELCRAVYGVERVDKKHRVAVLRALRTLVGRNEIALWRFTPRYEKADAAWFDPRRIGQPTHAEPLEPRRPRAR